MTYQVAQGLLRALISEATAQKSDVYYEYKVQDLAADAARIFAKDKHGTQMKNLENVSLSAQALADVYSFIKTQAGKDTSTGTLWRDRDFAKKLVEALEDSVTKDAVNLGEGIWNALKKINPEALPALREGNYNEADLKRTLRLHLVRLFVQHLVAHYAYSSRVPA